MNMTRLEYLTDLEVARHLPRNMTSDIWSLGCVVPEMIFVLKGKWIENIVYFSRSHVFRIMISVRLLYCIY